MTIEQATKLAQTLNNNLKETGADTLVVYNVFAYWSSNYEKQYNVIMYPKIHDGKYETADYSQKLAFARVSIKAQLKASKTYEGFNSDFEEQTDMDPELSNYFKKNN
jgi:hypothetical protein